MATTLELILLYLVAAVMGVVVCRLLRLPPMLGYLAVGVLIGPHALARAGPLFWGRIQVASVQRLQQLGIEFWRGRGDVAAFQKAGLAREVADQPARLTHE